MREERDAACSVRLDERETAMPSLKQEPDAEEDDGRNFVEEEEKSEEERGQHRGAREEHEVRAEHAGDGPARADVRDARVLGLSELERHEGLQRGRGEPAR